MTRLTKAQREVNPDQITAQLAEAKRQIDAWTNIAEQAKEQLVAAHRDGLVPTKFDSEGYTFNLQEGRRSWEYQPLVKAKIKEIQEHAKAAGYAQEKVGEPFWRLTPAKTKA
jgi:hypothetical protein